ncbi:MAG: DUF4350 domain-containing protein [Sulfolobales archaeon]
MAARVIAISLLIMIVIILGLQDIAIPTIQAYDPPSIYNTGRGGYSDLYVLLRRIGFSVDAIDSTSQIQGFDPKSWILVMASPDRDLGKRDADLILKWISAGGKAVILDELGTVNEILYMVGLNISGYSSNIDLASCRLGDRVYGVVFNVYRVIDISGSPNATIICVVHGIPTAVGISIGGGELIFIADSSIVINEVLASRYRESNVGFFIVLLGRRNVLFYEGNREIILLKTSYILKAFLVVPALIIYSINAAYSAGPIAVSMLMIGSFMMASLWLISSLGIYRSVARPRAPRGKRHIDIDSIMMRGVERWRRLVRR